jgi:hypothetical protein
MKLTSKMWLDIPLTVSCVVIAVLVVKGHFDANDAASTQALSSRPFPTGQHLNAIPGVDFSLADQTLVLVIRSNCPFCTASMPLYREIATQKAERQGALQIVAMSDEPLAQLQQYLRDNRLPVDSTVSARVITPGTPTLVLVDRSGTVKYSWLGKAPDQNSEQRIIDFIFHG